MASGLLVDTCAAIWILEDASLAPAAISALDFSFDENAPVCVSNVTAWEFGMLAARGRLNLRLAPLSAFAALLERAGMFEVPMTADILVTSSFLPGQPPKDPFDRIVIATARIHGLTILTRDRLILEYAKSGHVSALAC